MPDPATFLPGLLILLLGAVMIWFTVGTTRNISRGNRLLRWLQDGLGAIGPRTTMRWLGSSVVQLGITNLRHPYRQANLMLVMEPRDLNALWVFARRRGRRDFLILRLDLVRAPQWRADLVDPAAWTAGDRRQDEPEPERHREWTDALGRSIHVDHDDNADVASLRSAWDALTRDSGGAWRISVHPTVPHLEVHLLAPDPARHDARRLLDEVGLLARSVVARP